MARRGKSAAEETDATIPIEYVESADFKKSFVDGARGGVTRNDIFYATFYSEQMAMPTAAKRRVVVEEDGVRLGPEEVGSVEDLKFTRTAEFGVYMTQPVLASVVRWLTGKLEEMESKMTTASEGGSDG